MVDCDKANSDNVTQSAQSAQRDEEFKAKYIDKLMKIETHEGRVIIGKLKCVDDRGNMYLVETVEVFDKQSDRYVKFDLFENHPERMFYFDSERNHYQLYSNCIVPMKEVKRIIMAKQQ